MRIYIILAALVSFFILPFSAFGATNADWKMDGDSVDSSGNALNGTDTSVSYETGKLNEAASFDGAASRIALPNNSLLRPTLFTVRAWVMVDSISGYDTIFTSYNADSGWASGFYFLIENGKLKLTSARNTGSTEGVDYKQLIGNTTLAINTWYYVAATYDGSALKVYVNGQEDGVVSWSYSPVYYNNTAYTYIGTLQTWSGSGYSAYMGGLIDEVKILNTGLNGADILADYESFLPPSGETASSTAQEAFGNYLIYSLDTGLIVLAAVAVYKFAA